MSEQPARRGARRAPRRIRRVVGVSCAAFVLISAAEEVVAAPPDPPSGPDDAAPEVDVPEAATGVVATTSAETAAALIEGYRGEVTHRFVVPAGRRPTGDGTAEVTFRLPDLVADVVVSAQLNGSPIGSWLLGDGPSLTPVEITLPATALVDGSNELLLETVVPLVIDGLCPSWSHPARWIEIVGPVVTEVPTRAVAAPPLSAFPGIMAADDAATTIVIDRVDGDRLTAAAALGGAIVGELGRDHTIRVALEGDEVVGTSVRLAPGDGSGSISIGTDDAGLPRVDVVAPDGAALVELATALAQPGARSHMTRSSIAGASARALLSTEAAVPIREAGDEWLAGVTLDDLGYGGASLDGPGTDQASYSFDLPVGDIASFMTVTVDAAASAGGPDWSAGIDVYVNGRLVGNGSLGDQLDSFDVEIPRQVLRPGTNFIRLESDLGPGSGCSSPAPPTQRIDVMGTTTFRLRHGSPLAADLDDLPYLLRASSDTRTTTIITPADPTGAEATRAVQLAVLLGGRGNAASIATADEDAAEPVVARHLVLFGTPDRQPRLAELSRALPLGGEVPERWPADIELQLGGVRHGASIQLATADDEGVLLAVVAASDGDAIAGVDALLDAELRGDLVGTMALAAAEPLGAVSVRYDGAPLAAERSTATAGIEGVTDSAVDDRVGDAADEVEPVVEAADRRIELLLLGLGVAVLAGGTFAIRRFGITRPAGSSGV